MSLLIILLVMVALISSCVVYVVLRDRRTSGNRTRFEPGRQDAPVTEEAGMNLQGYWSGNITP